MERAISAEEGIAKLLQIRGNDLGLAPVLQRFNPDHAHWKEEPWGFQTGPDLYRWLFTWGLPHFIGLKLNLDKAVSVAEASRRLYEKYFNHYGISGDIEVSGEGLLDYHTGVRIDPLPNSPLWPAKNVVKLFPEVDFLVGFDYPEADSITRQKIQAEAYILLNTTKAGAESYRPHLIGYPLRDENVVPLTHGQGYRARLDTWLQDLGLTRGINGLVINDRSAQLIAAFLEAKAVSLNLIED